MGLLDEVLGSLARGGQPASRAQSSNLLEGVLEMLARPSQDGGFGGLEGLARAFQQQGLGSEMSSWVGTGQNQPVSPDALSRALGRDPLDRLAQRSGVGADLLPGILAAVLPKLVDGLTPQGRVAPQSDLMSLGRNLFGDAPAQGGASMASGDRKKPDFSNVQSGSSSTAPPPAAKTHTVAAGESLSKIAKKHYGDANQWKKIFEANRDQIKNPDLIHPGQVLKIP